ncbi:TraB family protein, partial [Candidatus Woesearchaeota archaeon]|nr:TraB family protein [Candidatus Woesearchaeota archaeon]MBL7050618.1 TraB family protein [Candidatus Woesearchaeota archaeon]
MKYKNLTIIGTSHIAKESIDQVKKAIESQKPEIIGVELDKKRLSALLHKGKRSINLKDIFRIGLKGFIFSLIGAWVEKKLGEMVGVKPGTEMLTAVKLAKKHKTQLALIDQDIEITLKRLSQEITWKEKFNFLADIVKAVIFRKKEIDFDLTKVPKEEIIKKLINKVKKRYPSIYKVLIKERNKIIAKNLFYLIQSNKKTLAIIGAGHEKEVIELIKDQEVVSYSFKIKQNT